MAAVAELAGVTIRRGSAILLDDVSLRIDEGERWVVIGPNGAGKTTLLQLLSAQMYPTDGVVGILDEVISAVDVFELRPGIGLTSSALAQRIPDGERVRDVVLSAAYAIVGRWREEYDEIDVVPVLRVRTAHVLSPMSTTATLREFWDGLPVKSDRVYKKQLASAGVLREGKDGQPLAVERTVGHTRVSNMVAFKLEGLRQYGLHAAVPSKGHAHAGDGYGDEPGAFGV